jgi:methylaspartate mutase epsilon subunit
MKMIKLENKKLSEDSFYKIRKEILNHWPTGKDIDLYEASEYLKQVPDSKSFSSKLRRAKTEGVTLAQPRAGVALVDEHIKLLQYLQNEGGADLLPSTIDSYTRQNRYEECKIGIEESIKQNRSMLNGFPVVNHGVNNCRKVLEALNLPLQVRHGTPDARLLSEIVYAGGWTSNEGGGISYNIPYAKSVSVEQTISNWQYCDRLTGIYGEMGVEINREPFGPLTGTLVPPSISNAVAIIEGLLAAEQGVKNITLGYGQCGNIIQDIAAIRSLEELGDEYFKTYGYDVFLTTVLHQWMGGFPADEARAFAVISSGAATAAMAGATKVIVKTPHEAMGIPTMEANAQGIRATKQMLNLLKEQKFPLSQELTEEVNLIKEETKCILEHVFQLGKGDLAIGAVEAFKSGAIDIPFAPSKYNAGKMLPARDDYGAVRYLDFGNIPMTKEIKEKNRCLLEKRGKTEGREVCFQMAIDDIYAVSKGSLVGRVEKGSII